jgi:hypothetical protein
LQTPPPPHTPDGQSAPFTHEAHIPPVQRPVSHSIGSLQGSPTFSLQPCCAQLPFAQLPPPLQIAPTAAPASGLHTPEPSHSSPAFGHAGCPGTPIAWFVHVPRRPGIAHDAHDALQSVEQQTPSEQVPAAQSPAAAQSFPRLHGLQDPPQSTSLSSPFLMPSSHATHTPPTHLLETQSVPEPQLFPFAHFAQDPPQSTSLSSPFVRPSVQLTQMPGDTLASQRPLSQSVPTLHSLPSAHGAHVPPQSTSVSLGSSVPFAHPLQTPPTQSSP